MTDRISSIIFVSDEALVPTNRGGRVETFNEVASLVDAGARVALLVPVDVGDDEVAVSKLHTESLGVARVITYKRPGKIVSNLRRPWLPHISASRMPRRTQTDNLMKELRSWKGAEFILCAHDYMLPVALLIAGGVGLPVVLRSHNDEFLALTASARGSTNLVRGMYLHLDAWRLRIANRRLVRRVSAIAVLSEADRAGYHSFPGEPVVIGPILTRPLGSSELAARNRKPPAEPVLVFVGALDTPQTLHGLMWFLSEVEPALNALAPEAVIRIVGRNAPPSLVESLSKRPSIDFRGHVDDIYPEIAGARAFINPVHLGSGVNMKMGPPAELGVPIVTTAFGLRGLSALSQAALVSTTASAFADDCARILVDDDLWSQLSEAGPRELASMYSSAAFATRLRDATSDIRHSWSDGTRSLRGGVSSAGR